MNKKKILQQKLLARVIIVCGVFIIITSFFINRMGKTTLIGCLFLIIGTLTLRIARQYEEQLNK